MVHYWYCFDLINKYCISIWVFDLGIGNIEDVKNKNVINEENFGGIGKFSSYRKYKTYKILHILYINLNYFAF